MSSRKKGFKSSAVQRDRCEGITWEIKVTRCALLLPYKAKDPPPYKFQAQTPQTLESLAA